MRRAAVASMSTRRLSRNSSRTVRHFALMRLNPHSFAFTLLLGALSALPSLSIDMGLPGIPALEADFADAAGRGALTLSLFLAGFALAPSVCGPIADRYGRRPTMVVGLVLFTIAASLCAVSPDFTLLLVCRLLQGIAAGACVTMPMAVVRDLFEGTQARTRLAHITTVLGLAPMLAPILGAWVMSVAGWRTIYAAQAGLALIILLAILLGFSETLPVERRRALSPRQLAGTYRMVLGNRTFINYAFVYAFSFAGMFAYISSSSAVVMGSFGLSGHAFSLLFAACSCGVMLGSMLSGRLSRRHVPSHKVLNAGLAVMFLAELGALALSLLGLASVWTLMPLIAITIFCFGLTAPNATHEALHPLPHAAGAASGLSRCFQMVLGAASSALVAALSPLGHPALVMSAIMVGMMALAGLFYLSQLRLEHKQPAAARA